MNPLPSLAPLRRKLDRWNRTFFLALKQRREIVSELQSRKLKLSGQFSHYDPQREWELFSLFKEQLRELTLAELLAYSLIMESHASQGSDLSYPLWSQGAHLSGIQEGSRLLLIEMINPLLLKAAHQEQLQKINLLHDFEKILSLFSFNGL